MSSYTVTITGNSSTLSSVLFPALNLQHDKLWEIALLDFTTYNSIPNIIENINNKLYYIEPEKDIESETLGKENMKPTKDLDSEEKKIGHVSLLTGSYEIEAINRKLKEVLGEDAIDLTANNSLLRTELKSKYYIDFSKKDSLGSVLGFPTSNQPLEPDIVHISPLTVNIIKVNTINITCNIVQGSYINGRNDHTLHTFYPTVPSGFKIVEKPHNLVYLPINTSYISDIVVSVLDQDGNVIDFRGETITLRLHIRVAI